MKEIQEWVTKEGDWHIQRNSGEYRTPNFKMITLCGIERKGFSYGSVKEKDLKPCQICFDEYKRQTGEDWTKLCSECGFLMRVNGSFSHVEGTCFQCGFFLKILEDIQTSNDDLITVLAMNVYPNAYTGEIEKVLTLYQFYEGIVSGKPLGSGGSKFTFVLADGREAISNNVGCRGNIPDRFFERFKPYLAKSINRGK